MRYEVSDQARLSEILARMTANEHVSSLNMLDIIDSDGFYVGSIVIAKGDMAEELVSRAAHHMIGPVPVTSH